MPAEEADAVVIGAGVNGLVAAVLLAKGGWTVTLIEGNQQPGGALATEELTLPGYRHDTFASWHGTFVNGPAWPLLRAELQAHGLRYRAAQDLVTATVRRDGTSTFLHRDPERTAAYLGADGEIYLEQLRAIRRAAPIIGSVLAGEPTPRRLSAAAVRLVARVGLTGSASLARQALTSGRDWGRRTFTGTDVDALVAPWLLHAGLSPDSASGAFTGLLMLDGLHRGGLPVAEGGSARLVDALVASLHDHHGHLVTGVPATEVLVEGGRAAGVVAGGRRFLARRAVVASVTPEALYGHLLPRSAPVPERVRTAAARFLPGRSAMQVHVALSAPLRWSDSRVDAIPLVHIADGSAGVALACAQAEAGLLPARPTIVVGQQYLLDRSRVPTGAAALWIQLQEVPARPIGDASGGPLDGWSVSVIERYVERVLDQLADHAPNLPDVRLATSVLAPPDLQRRNPNLVDGDPYGGRATLDQLFAWRPVPSSRGHRTAVRGLWHIGASTHPGPGLGGASGYSVARTLLSHAHGRNRRAGRTLAQLFGLS